jgi:hypothetical protein
MDSGFDQSKREASTRPGTVRKRRRRIVLDWGFQVKVAAFVFLSVLAVTAIASFTLYGVLFEQARQRALFGAAELPGNAFNAIVFAIAIAAAPALALGFWSILITHRICGPIRVMFNQFQELASGGFPALRPLRKNDELREFYGEFRQAVDYLKVRREGDREAITAVLADLRAAAAGNRLLSAAVLEAMAAKLETVMRERTPAQSDLAKSQTAMEGSEHVKGRLDLTSAAIDSWINAVGEKEELNPNEHKSSHTG